MACSTVFVAKKVITMNPSNETATHIVVTDDRITAVGGAELAHNACQLDTRFADKVIMPGLIEGHSHTLEGLLWNYVYVGFHDRCGPDGRLWPGLKSIDAVVTRLQAAAKELQDDSQTLIAWGFDPILFGQRRMNVADLAKVSTQRPVVILHASAHCINVNSVVLERAGLSSETPFEGVIMDCHGKPSGELREMAAMFVAFEAADVRIFDNIAEQDLWNFGHVARRAGVTTAADLFNPLTSENLDGLCKVTTNPDYPIRLVPAFSAPTATPAAGADYLRECMQRSNDKLYIGSIKLMTDGSIQGFTARLKAGTYHNGAPNGIWNTSPEEIHQAIQAYNEEGIQLNIHVNGDEASEVILNSLAQALERNPQADHRHTLQHCQLITEAQLEQAAQYNVCVNMFANHLYYWGDTHYAHTVGPERAEQMEPFHTVKRLGVKFSMHSDAPVTHLSPLFTAWCAVNRVTSQGRVLGEAERITVDDALRAITIDAAYLLKLDHLVGSIECGKLADFTVLEQDPYQVDEIVLKDIPIVATVLGGNVQELNKRTAEL